MHFNPRSPCGERLYSAYNFPLAQGISIHAPRAGSDSANPGLSAISRNFNPRSPCGERRENGRECGKGGKIFQSTLPVRGATILLCFVASMFYISIHAPRAGSDIAFRIGSRILVVISIHVPRAGSDEKLTGNGNAFVAISIHAPRAGSDAPSCQRRSGRSYFNPRSPCGERRREDILPAVCGNFNPRSPCGERRCRACWPTGQSKDFNPRSPCGERLAHS